MRTTALLALAVTASAAFACSAASSGGGAAGSGGAGGGTTGVCVGDTRAQVYTPDMEAPAVMGVFRVRLVSIDPAPAIKGSNTWVVEIVDTAGAAVTGATVVAKPFMPDHGHGSSIVPTVTEMGGGKYTIDSLVLFMPGLWETTIAVSTPGAADRAVFSFCVPG